MIADALGVDVETLEDGLVDQASLLFIASAVELLGLSEEAQAGLDQSSAIRQVIVRCLPA